MSPEQGVDPCLIRTGELSGRGSGCPGARTCRLLRNHCGYAERDEPQNEEHFHQESPYRKGYFREAIGSLRKRHLGLKASVGIICSEDFAKNLKREVAGAMGRRYPMHSQITLHEPCQILDILSVVGKK